MKGLHAFASSLLFAACAAGPWPDPQPPSPNALSPSQIGDSAALALVLDDFRRSHTPQTAELKVSFARLDNGELDFLYILSHELVGLAGDSLRREFSPLIHKPPIALPARAITLKLINAGAPVLTASESFVVLPKFRNKGELQRILARFGPTVGMTGTVHLSVLVGTTGVVEDVVVNQSSRTPGVDMSVKAAIRRVAFTPAKIDGFAIPMWTLIPVSLENVFDAK